MIDAIRAGLLRVARRKGTRRDATTLARIAARERAAGRFSSAARFAQAAIAADPLLPDGYGVLGQAFASQGAYERAREAYRRGAERVVGDPYLLCALGDLEYAHGRYAEAEQAYRDALGRDPGEPARSEAQANLGLALFQQGRLDEASALLEGVANMPLGTVSAALALARIRSGSGRHDEATAILESAGRQHPESAPAQYDLAYALTRVGRWREAYDAARCAVDLDPSNATYRELLAALRQRDEGQE